MAEEGSPKPPQVVRERDAQVLMEGQERTLVYAHTDKLIFSVSTLLPGNKSAQDPGHIGAHEVVYAIQGSIVMEFPGLGCFVQMEAGDALLIPEGEPHLFHNVGTEMARLAWGTAPHLGRAR